jgi:hypothetical protein
MPLRFLFMSLCILRKSSPHGLTVGHSSTLVRSPQQRAQGLRPEMHSSLTQIISGVSAGGRVAAAGRTVRGFVASRRSRSGVTDASVWRPLLLSGG